MSLEALITALQALKGSGQWRDVAKEADVDYTTISRIYRGDMKNPGIKTVEKLLAAIKKVRKPAKSKRKTDRRDIDTGPPVFPSGLGEIPQGQRKDD